MLGDLLYRGFVVGLAANLAHPRGWFGIATMTGGDLSDGPCFGPEVEAAGALSLTFLNRAA